MDFLQVIEERYSVRKFADKPVETDIINKILAAGHLAPTGCNYQPQRILVINEAEALERLKLCTKCHFNAPTAMLICYNKEECWTRKYDGKTCGVSDACIVTTHMMLAATNFGLGTTWVMHFDPIAMRKEFNIPKNVEPVALLVMGYPASDCEPRYDMHNSYRPIDEVVKYNKF